MKGQLIGQIFIYVVTVIIVAFILAYGYKAIITFKKNSEQVSYIKFKNDLQNTIEVLTADFGSVKIKEFALPDNIKKVCFVESYPEIPDAISNPEIDNYPIIKDSIRDKINKNIFLIEDNVENSFFAGKISMQKDLYCISVTGNTIELRMESMGDHTSIS